MIRLCVEQDLSSVASRASPGMDEVRWLAPARPGDALSIRVTARDARRSALALEARPRPRAPLARS